MRDVQDFRERLRVLGKNAQILIYSGADHAFANPSGGNYNEKAATESWQETLTFLDENLESRGALRIWERPRRATGRSRQKKGAGCKNIHILRCEDMSMFAAGNPAPRGTAVRLGQRTPRGEEWWPLVFDCLSRECACGARELELRRQRAFQILIERNPELGVQRADVILDFRSKHALLHTEADRRGAEP